MTYIAYLLDTFPSPTETFIAREIEALRRRGVVVRVFALNAREGAEALPLPGGVVRWKGLIEKVTSGARDGYFEELGAAWWRGLTDDVRSGIGHIHAGWASHPASMALGAAREAGLPWSFSGHARDLFVDGERFDGKLEAARFATVCTRAGQRLLRERAPQYAEKVLYAPHGIEIARYPYHEHRNRERRAAVGSGEPLKILSVGRLVEKKGLKYLLDAAALLQELGIATYTVLVGEGPLHGALQRQAERLQLTDSVHFAGALPHEEVIAGMQEADCLVLPCVVAADGDRDGLPNVLLEAAACGLPLISTRAGSVTDFMDDTTGWLCPPADATALAEALAELRAEPETAEVLRQAARHRVVELFDVDINIEILLQAFAA